MLEDAIDQPASRVTLLSVNENNTGEGRAAITGSEGSFDAVLCRRHSIGVQSKTKSESGQQFAVAVILGTRREIALGAGFLQLQFDVSPQIRTACFDLRSNPTNHALKGNAIFEPASACVLNVQ
jgi:hypothetical protein